MEKKSIFMVLVTIVDEDGLEASSFGYSLGGSQTISLSSAKMQYYAFIEAFFVSQSSNVEFVLRDAESKSILCLVRRYTGLEA